MERRRNVGAIRGKRKTGHKTIKYNIFSEKCAISRYCVVAELTSRGSSSWLLRRNAAMGGKFCGNYFDPLGSSEAQSRQAFELFVFHVYKDEKALKRESKIVWLLLATFKVSSVNANVCFPPLISRGMKRWNATVQLWSLTHFFPAVMNRNHHRLTNTERLVFHQLALCERFVYL